MVLIGGVATIIGLHHGRAAHHAAASADSGVALRLHVFVSTDPNQHPNVFEVNVGLYGLLIIAFLLFEPRGLFGIWHRVRTYWKSLSVLRTEAPSPSGGANEKVYPASRRGTRRAFPRRHGVRS